MKNVNDCVIEGTISSELELSHKMKYVSIYNFTVDVERSSGVVDKIPAQISSYTLGSNLGCDLSKWSAVKLKGSIRSYRIEENDKSKLVIKFYVNEVSNESSSPRNSVKLIGYVCKISEIRKTPGNSGKSPSEICDVIIACNRNSTTDYLPVILWNKCANYFYNNYNVGDLVEIVGRLQSRDYVKIIDGNEVVKTAYEVSVFNITKVEDKD